MEKFNWIKIKVRGLNWNGKKLEDWIELWLKLKGVNYNLAQKKRIRAMNKAYFLSHHHC